MNPVVEKPRPDQIGFVLAPLLWLGVAALAVCVLAALMARLHPLFELFVHFPALYLVAGLVLGLFALLARRYWIFVVALGLGLSNLAPLWPYVFEAPPKIAAGGPVLKLVSANLNHMHADAAALRQFLATTDADIVVLTELAGHQEPVYAQMKERFPEQMMTPGNRHRPFALQLLARRKLESIVLHQPFGLDYPVLELRHCDEAARGCLTIIALHAVRPGGEFGDLRDRLLDFAATRVKAAAAIGDQAAVAGDLNATPWSPAFDGFVSLGLRDAGLGQGWQPTWPVALGVAGIPIDHVLVSPAIAVRGYRRLAPMGSDHWPLAVDLVLPAKSR
jgi:endonuclease/exonuclease/phosphatase (EEP) superfamily protein YafD